MIFELRSFVFLSSSVLLTSLLLAFACGEISTKWVCSSAGTFARMKCVSFTALLFTGGLIIASGIALTPGNRWGSLYLAAAAQVVTLLSVLLFNCGAFFSLNSTSTLDTVFKIHFR